MSNTKTLANIEALTLTLQQSRAFDEYSEQVLNGERVPSEQDFKNFYSFWCFDNSRYNDINQSLFL